MVILFCNNGSNRSNIRSTTRLYIVVAKTGDTTTTSTAAANLFSQASVSQGGPKPPAVSSTLPKSTSKEILGGPLPSMNKDVTPVATQPDVSKPAVVAKSGSSPALSATSPSQPASSVQTGSGLLRDMLSSASGDTGSGGATSGLYSNLY